MLCFEMFQNLPLRFKQSSRPNWADLPRDIIGLIINKLRFLDQIHALAVCKSWHDCANYVRCSDRLSWAVSCRVEDSGRNKYLFLYELFDPYSQKVLKASNSAEVCTKLREIYTVYVSKNGWLLQEIISSECDTSFFLHNPFTNHIFLLPFSVDTRIVQAAMKEDPSSPECQIFILSFRYDFLYIHTYCLSKDDDFQLELAIRTTVKVLHSVLYMKGNIYALFEGGVLYSYSLEDKSWKLLAPRLQEPYDMIDAWLLEIDGNVAMVYVGFEDESETVKWRVFMFDWSEMSWIVETSLKSCAIYVSDSGAFSAPLTNCFGEKLEGCMLFYNEEIIADSSDVGFGFKRYSCNELTGNAIRSDVYNRMLELCFVEPPYSVT